ncbi:hypothetical protein GCM10017044_07500 [Kordiimonas sediminis]|uniref:DUF2333 family protein n=1 Tax=Kordiimonas sediminis TaxID=1735581 RepID=A0A919AMH9_9PROT|nr:DUF2333 family protein [Kordiimonas sediminis]GHF15789.1 hypothetical protein GCM10017044_07500 [Kordiimonas sediminis]
MLHEVWLWIKEKIALGFQRLGAALRRLWRFFLGYLATVSGSTWRKVAVALPVLFFLYILIGMAISYRVDDRLYVNTAQDSGAPQTVATVIYLVEREAKLNNWTANDPVFLPGWWLDNTPNFQKGILGALSRFTFELRDQIGRTRGSSAVDVDIEKAAGNLSKEPDRWIMDFSTSLLPTTPSDAYFREGARQLTSYVERLKRGDAVYETRGDNLLATFDRIALDLGASSAALESYIEDNAGGVLPDRGADDLFYQIKGQVYAYSLLLRALKHDFSGVIEDKDLGKVYDQLIVSMDAAASLDPLVVTNGSIDGMLANHLAMQGFYLLRARTQIREVSNILLK